MTTMQRVAGRILLGVLGMAPLWLQGQGEPRLERPRLSYATSPRIHRYSWGQLGCLLQNPDTRPREVAVRLLMDAQGGMNQRTVMTRHVQIPARAEMYYRSLAMVEDADQYKLELFVGDRRVPGAESMAFRLLSDREAQMAVINDADELSFGSFSSYDALKERWRTAFFRAADLPDAWPFFQYTHAVILLAPDFSRCSDRQLMSLREYVVQGGRLILAHPRAIQAMAESSLADLLPLMPLRQREITTLPSLARYAPGFRGWVEETQPMLECEPVGDGVTLLAEGDLPVFRWRRHGLGEVRASAIPLTEDGLRQAAAFLPLAKVFLGTQPLYADRSHAERCLDEMTGFSVPGPGVVRRIFLVYFLLLAALMTLGFRIRRSMLAWGVGAALGVLVTALVLHRAARGGGTQDGRLLAMLEIGSDSVTEGYYGVFSQKDTTVDMDMPDGQSLPSAIPPPGSAFRLGMMGAEGGGEPVEISVHGGTFGIRGLTVRSNTSRTFTVLAGSGSPPAALAGAVAPEVILGGDAPAFTPWPLPEGRRPEAAWLLFPSGALPLAVEKGALMLPRRDGAAFQGNEIVRSVQDFLQVGSRKPTLCLAWLESVDEGRFPTPDQTTCRGRRITLVPVREAWQAGPDGEFVVEPEQVVLSAADSSTRMLMAGNRLREDGSAPRMIQDMTLRFHLPSAWAALSPSRIELVYDLVNPAGNLTVTPVLIPDPGVGMPVPIQGAREIPAREDGRQHVFAEGLDGLLDPHEGTGLLRLKFVNRDDERGDGVVNMRLNHWQIGGLRLRLVGTLPEGMDGTRF
jgi:hypothetical protein